MQFNKTFSQELKPYWPAFLIFSVSSTILYFFPAQIIRLIYSDILQHFIVPQNLPKGIAVWLWNLYAMDGILLLYSLILVSSAILVYRVKSPRFRKYITIFSFIGMFAVSGFLVTPHVAQATIPAGGPTYTPSNWAGFDPSCTYGISTDASSPAEYYAIDCSNHALAYGGTAGVGGATGTNLTTVTNKALTTGSKVEVGAGTFVSNGGTINGVSNAVLKGQGVGVTIFQMANSGVASGTRPFLQASTIQNFTLQGISFNENGKNQGGSDEVKFNDCSFCLVTQNSFYNPYDSPFLGIGSYYSLVAGSGFLPLATAVSQRFTTYSYNYFSNVNAKITTSDEVDAGNGYDIQWIGNTFNDSLNVPALSIAALYQSQVSYNQIVDSGNVNCIQVGGSQYTTISYNSCQGLKDTSEPDFVDMITFTDLGVNLNNYQVTIDHNSMTNVGYGLHFSAPTTTGSLNFGIDFSYNTITNATYGIGLAYADGVTISYNNIFQANPTAKAYNLAGGSSITIQTNPAQLKNVQIIGNTLEKNTGISAYLMYGFQYGATNVLVSGNNVGNATGLTGDKAQINQNDTLFGNTGYNALGSLTNPFHTTSAYISDGGADTAAPANKTTYTVGGSTKNICITIGGAWSSAYTFLVKIDGTQIISTTAPTGFYCLPSLASGETVYFQFETGGATFTVSGQ